MAHRENAAQENAALEELDRAELTTALPEEDLVEGDSGTVVAVLKRDEGASHEGSPEAYVIELMAPPGAEPKLITVKASSVRPARGGWQGRWTPWRIKTLRGQLGMTQAQMGPLIWEGSPATARKNLANLERGATRPSAAVARTLRRLEDRLSQDRLQAEPA